MRRTTLLVDTETRWIHRPSDLLGAGLAVLGIFGVLFLSIYASSTTLAVTADARDAATNVLHTVLFMPINVLEGLLTFFTPLLVLTELIWTRRIRALVTTIAAAGGAALTATLTALLLREYFPDADVTAILAVAIEGQSIAILVPYVAVLAAFYTAAGPRATLTTLRWSWPLFWVVLVLSILQGQQTLPGAISTVFLGLAVGQFTRFLIGDIPTRATELALIRLLRRTGVDATEVVRIGPEVAPESLVAWRVQTSSPIGYQERFRVTQIHEFISRTFDPIEADEESQLDYLTPELLVDPVDIYRDYQSYSVPLAESVSRNYIAIDTIGQAHHVAVLDGDRHVLDRLSSLWSKVRLKVQFRRADSSIHETANHVTLMTLAAQHVGVDVPDLEGVAASDDSVVISSKVMRAPTLDQLGRHEITDDLLDQVWMILARAHEHGIAHRNIHAGIIVVDSGNIVITNWQDGTIASSEVSRRIDIAQALAMMMGLVGQRRTLASFERIHGSDQLVPTSPLLQKSIMPKQTVGQLSKEDFTSLREEMTKRIPATEGTATIEVRRFSPKTVISLSIGVIAVYILLGSINFSDVWDAVAGANLFYLALAAAGSFTTFVGAALTLKAYTPEKLPLTQTTLVQMAAAIIKLVVPAGIGPAALNLRYLNKKGVPTALGLATVSLVQIAQFLATVILLAGVALLTGDIGSLTLPSPSVLITIGVTLAVVALALVIRPVRRWLAAKVGPTFDKVWPRIVWLANHPERIAFGALGSLVQTAGFVIAFGFALASLGYSLPILTLAITFLVSNTVGSIVPSPGGIGPVEAALTGGLAVAGVPYSIALSTSLIYRLLTFWGPVPFAWFALRYLQRKDLT